MGLKDAIRSAVDAAFTALGDMVTAATYHSSGTFAWAPATGNQVETGGSDIAVSKLLLSSFKSEEIDGEKILFNDEKALIPRGKLPSITPKETDYITISGVVRNVQSVRHDPVQALWILHVRRAGL